jgi:uncharacterized protein
MRLRAKLGGLAVLLFALTSSLSAEPVSQLKPSGYVNDFAHVLTPEAAAQISDLCRQIDQKAKAQIALVTINTLDGSDIETFAVDLYKSWGIGYKGADRGVLILYAIQDHRARIEVGYGLEPILPDGKVGGFQREAVPRMRSGDYSGALLLVTRRVADVIAQDAGVQLTGAVPRPPPQNVQQPEQEFHLSLGKLVIIAIVFLLVLGTPFGRSLLWFFLFNSLGSGRGGGGFGGFGGGGGGGFGGFGGGSSGGGGASSSW